jgi:uncharacterized protein YciI
MRVNPGSSGERIKFPIMRSLHSGICIFILLMGEICAGQQKGSAGNQVQSMGHYWFVMFSRGANWGHDSVTTAKLFQEHIHYIIRQRETGKIITGGAFLDKATWIGFEIYSCLTSKEVEKITEADPAVSSKIFSYEIHPWATLKGEVKFQ